MNQQEILEIFKQSKALLNGHFRLTSGFHSNQYLQCAMVLQYPDKASLLAQELIKALGDTSAVTAVVGPAIGGITLSYETARQLNCKSIFAERKEGTMVLRRGFELNKNDTVLVVEDVITTGGSVKEVVELIKQTGAKVASVGSIVDRSGGQAVFGTPYSSVLSMEVVKYDPESCPLCKDGIELNSPGSRYSQTKG